MLEFRDLLRKLDSCSGNQYLKDLFDDEEDEEKSDMTTHGHRIAAIREQTQGLEAHNVAQKDWMRLGEVGSRQRPEKTLFEEDLDFERLQNAVPIIFEETINGRILGGRSDDVIHFRAFGNKPFRLTHLLELQDIKFAQDEQLDPSK